VQQRRVTIQLNHKCTFSPVFFHIGGEGPISVRYVSSMSFIPLAQKYHALIFALVRALSDSFRPLSSPFHYLACSFYDFLFCSHLLLPFFRSFVLFAQSPFFPPLPSPPPSPYVLSFLVSVPFFPSHSPLSPSHPPCSSPRSIAFTARATRRPTCPPVTCAGSPHSRLSPTPPTSAVQ